MSGELFTSDGERKYLTASERQAFLLQAEKGSRELRTFCAVLVHTGCRISEALALAPEHVDISSGVIVFESLKKRRKGVFRAVPIPPSLIDALDLVHNIRKKKNSNLKSKPIWSWSRISAWRYVKEVMDQAGIGEGAWATPKGLRHGFGVEAVSKGIPLNMLQKWLGHAQLSTTAIYANAVGEEEKNIASRMWGIS
ncbi:MAG: site-specific integrase [Proteobacteria bacterium]|nr:site-specific integrase [Pseudomonadota bacterium]